MILCVDPHQEARKATREALDAEGFETQGVRTMEEAMGVLREEGTIDCLIAEQTLPDGNGLELIQQTREFSPDTACILYTDVPLDEISTDEYGDMIAEYLQKGLPNSQEELVVLVEHNLSFLSQTAYPLPEHEDARLEALSEYTGNPEDLSESLDRLTQIATELFGLSSSAVGLIDAHHEQFLSCHGASFDSLDRENTICTYTILDEEVTVIENVPDDPRFAENEGLAAAGVKFYAGAPLVTADGHAIGVFCLHDSEPREFSDRDRRLLRLFGDETMERLELHRQLRVANRGEVGD